MEPIDLALEIERYLITSDLDEDYTIATLLQELYATGGEF